MAAWKIATEENFNDFSPQVLQRIFQKMSSRSTRTTRLKSRNLRKRVQSKSVTSVLVFSVCLSVFLSVSPRFCRFEIGMRSRKESTWNGAFLFCERIYANVCASVDSKSCKVYKLKGNNKLTEGQTITTEIKKDREKKGKIKYFLSIFLKYKFWIYITFHVDSFCGRFLILNF